MSLKKCIRDVLSGLKKRLKEEGLEDASSQESIREEDRREHGSRIESFVLGESTEIREELEELKIEPNDKNKDDSNFLERCLAFQYTQVGQMQRVKFFEKLNSEVVKSTNFSLQLCSDLEDKVKIATDYREQ